MADEVLTALADVKDMLGRLPDEVPDDHRRKMALRNWCIEANLKVHELIEALNRGLQDAG
jgi:hypothetical protein